MIRSNSSNPPEVRAADGATIVANRDFCGKLDQHHLSPLQRDVTTILQVNLGKKCNQACSHCHVEAGPLRTEMMNRRTAQRIIDLLQRSPKIEMVDLTGGAPELNPHFRWLVEQITDMGIPVIDRCNLTILLEEGMEDLASFLARHRVHIIASLPCRASDEKSFSGPVTGKAPAACYSIWCTTLPGRNFLLPVKSWSGTTGSSCFHATGSSSPGY